MDAKGGSKPVVKPLLIPDNEWNAEEMRGLHQQIVPVIAKEDDDDIDQYMLTREEAEVKDKLWSLLNADFLHRAEPPRKEGKSRSRKKRKAREPKEMKRSPEVAAASNETATMFPEKKASSRINYSKLKKLFPEDVDASKKGGDSETSLPSHSSDASGGKRIRFT